MSEPKPYDLKDYDLIHFDGKKLYHEDCLLKNLDPLRANTVTWFNKNREIHRIGKPAITQKSGICTWYCRGEIHRTDGPSYISRHMLMWTHRSFYHRIGGFAIFDVNRNDYRLYIHNKEYKNPKDYVHDCKEWFINKMSAHESLECIERLIQSYESGHLHAENWKDGKFHG